MPTVTIEGTPTAMVIAPHPDDAESGAGGTIATLLKQGCKVIVVICTNGDKGTQRRDLPPRDLAKIREAEQQEASKVLGVTALHMLGFPDQGLEDDDLFREKIVRLIRQYRPDMVFTMDPSRPYIIHRDHRMTGRVTLDSVFPTARDPLPYPQHLVDGLEPHKVRHVYMWGTENADSYFDVSETLDLKLKALFCHRSQMGEMGDASRTERWQKRYEELGQKAGVKYAEAFKHIELPG